MNDRPTAAELAAAARHFLETELLPSLTDPRLRFQTLVTANILAIAEREAQVEEEQLLTEWHWLAELLSSSDPAPARLVALREAVRAANQRLCERVRQGDYDDPERFFPLLRQLRRTVERKLEVANPRYLANFKDNA